MCLHFTKDEEVQEQPQVFVQEKIQPITLTLTPDEASLLTTYFSDHPIVQFGRSLLLKRAPETETTLVAKMKAIVSVMDAIQDQYPGYPVKALPNGVLA